MLYTAFRCADSDRVTQIFRKNVSVLCFAICSVSKYNGAPQEFNSFSYEQSFGFYFEAEREAI